MCAEKQKMGERSLLSSVLSNNCPRCREGKLFTSRNPYHLKTTMRMPGHCSVCGQPFELQTGFYFGTGYVSYFLSVGFILITAAIWYFTIGFSFNDNRLYWYLGIVSAFLLITQPIQQRFSRSIWIAFFIRYDKNWRQHLALQSPAYVSSCIIQQLQEAAAGVASPNKDAHRGYLCIGLAGLTSTETQTINGGGNGWSV